MLAATDFLWRDGERLIAFGRGVLGDAPELIGGAPYMLLTTPRAAAAAPALVSGAESVHHVGPGPVDELAEGLRPVVRGGLLVALGGGRVIDTAKALAAADSARRAAAVPTTLSGAEMTAIHRLPRGIDPATPRRRPWLVVNDPALSASQDARGLAASAMNALGHCVEAPLTTRRGPVSTLAAREGAALIAGALARDPIDRDALALGALLGGYAIDAAGYGLHHVMSQTLAREAGVGHGPANACMLPHTIGALRGRFPREIRELERALGADSAGVAARVAARAGTARLRDLGVPRERLPGLAEAAAARPDLDLTPPRAEADELLGIYRSAW